MAEIPEDLYNAINWDWSPLVEKITTLNLDKESTIAELCAYLATKYQKEEKNIQIGLGELARPCNKKMLFFNASENHTFVRLRLSTRRGRIEDGDSIPLTIKLQDDSVNRITVRIRSSTSKFTVIKACEGHAGKFRTKVSHL